MLITELQGMECLLRAACLCCKIDCLSSARKQCLWMTHSLTAHMCLEDDASSSKQKEISSYRIEEMARDQCMRCVSIPLFEHFTYHGCHTVICLLLTVWSFKVCHLNGYESRLLESRSMSAPLSLNSRSSTIVGMSSTMGRHCLHFPLWWPRGAIERIIERNAQEDPTNDHFLLPADKSSYVDAHTYMCVIEGHFAMGEVLRGGDGEGGGEAEEEKWIFWQSHLTIRQVRQYMSSISQPHYRWLCQHTTQADTLLLCIQ